jgi:transcriptional regulator with GAF, ATPase, and Fis domain
VGIERGVFYNIGSDLMLLDAISWTAEGVPGIDMPVSAKERFPWTLDQVMAEQVVCFSVVDELPNAVDRESFRMFETKSALVVPLSVEGHVKGAVAFSVISAERDWPPAVVRRLTVVARVLAQVLARHARDEEVRIAAAEARQLKDQLQVENVYLRQEARERLGHSRVVGQSAALKRVLEQIEHVAPTDSTVLLVGETGTGKELFATHIHELGKRHNRSMVRVNCAAIPPTLMESELFGRERGAFTGALARQMGRFEMADKSTIFLDEIGDLPLDVQVKLLRVLEERTIERLGSSQPIKVDVRIIAATHRNLERRIAEGAFREDLYYRLNVFPISVPPLRERVEDIPLLVWRFVEEFSKAFGRRIDSIDKATFTALSQYSWPGNIRELRNVVERAMIVATGHRLNIPLPHASATAARRSPKLVDVEKEHIRAVLESTGWRIRGSGGAADRLGLKPTTLETRMAKLGLRRPGHRQEG